MAKAQALDGADLVSVRPQTVGTPQRGAQRSVPSDNLVPLQFKMSAEFVREFKIEAAKRGLKLNELLKECFAALMKA